MEPRTSIGMPPTHLWKLQDELWQLLQNGGIAGRVEWKRQDDGDYVLAIVVPPSAVRSIPSPPSSVKA